MTLDSNPLKFSIDIFLIISYFLPFPYPSLALFSPGRSSSTEKPTIRINQTNSNHSSAIHPISFYENHASSWRVHALLSDKPHPPASHSANKPYLHLYIFRHPPLLFLPSGSIQLFSPFTISLRKHSRSGSHKAQEG